MPPEQIDETVEVGLAGCPHCGGAVADVSRVEQVIEELPVVRPHVTRVVTYRGRCGRCGWVRSHHPLQVSTATGAAGTQIGPRALGTAMHLLQEGLTRRKVCGVLRELFGLRLTPGGLVQATHRMGRRLAQSYDALQRQVRASTSIHVDETSWWVGGPKWWLWVFTRPELTLYRVVPARAREVIKQTLGPDYAGVLVSDCLVIYDNVCARQQKCYAHHLKAIGQAIEQHPRGGEGFLQAVRHLLKSALCLKPIWPELPARARQKIRENLVAHARDLLRAPPEHPLEAGVAQRLRKQEDHLFTFLDYPEVEATNNLAERQLRPAVIARKISCGNRTQRGAHTWEILASLAATARQNARAFRELVAHAALLVPEEGR